MLACHGILSSFLPHHDINLVLGTGVIESGHPRELACEVAREHFARAKPRAG